MGRGDCTDPPGWSLQGTTCRVPEAARQWSAAHQWPICRQWCPPSSRPTVVRDCYPDEGRHLWCESAAEVNDDFFKKEQTKKKKTDEVFDQKEKESTIDESRKAIQKDVDAKIVAAIGKVALLKEYMSPKFSLKKSPKPHEMTF